MKLLERTNVAGQRDAAGTGFNVPNSTITWLSVIYIVINTLSGALSNYISSTPQRITDRNNYSLREKNFELQALQRVLETKDEIQRRASLELLIHTGIIRSSKELLNYLHEKKSVPEWNARPVEPLSTYLAGSNISVTGTSPIAPILPRDDLKKPGDTSKIPTGTPR